MITREETDGIAIVRFAHGKVSAMDLEFCRALTNELSAVAASGAKAIVLTGSGSVFSAGVDLFRVLDGGRDYLQVFLPAMESLFRTVLTLPQPVVAAVNGHAIAGGCIIAAACDYRVMVEGSARIGIPELLVGVPFPSLPFEIVAARVSPAHLRQLVLSGRTVLASEAVDLGLVDDVAAADALMAGARETAAQMARIPAIAFTLTKRAFTDPILGRVAASRALNDAALEAWALADVQARIRAYVEQTVGKK
jgi:enoyl-CoA hydratase